MGSSAIAMFALAGAALAPVVWMVVRREIPASLSRRAKALLAVAVTLAAGVAAWRTESLLGAMATAVALGAGVTVAAVDAAVFRIPDRIVFPALAVTVALFAIEGFGGDGSAIRALAGGALFYAVLGAIHLVSPAKMGFGDVKLAALLGLPLGWQAWLAVPASLVLASLLGLLLHGGLVVAGRRVWHDELPFGLYLALGATVTVAIGGASLPSLVWHTG